jgi:collagen type VII alpha
MAFPGSPINGQITVVNNISYTYEAASNAWYRTGETTANAIVTDTATIVSNTASTSTSTGALTVAGGAGVAGNVHVGAVYTDSYFYANGTPFSTAGALGYTGSAGDIGFTGSASTTIGYTGSVGADGTIGVDGYTGSQGELGYTGSVGYTGSAGTDGTIGVDGYTGSQGVTGFTGSVGLLDWTPITANYTVSNRERLLLNSSTGSFTLTLPTAPATGTYIQLTDGANLATNPVTVDRNGSTIENLSSNLVLDVPNATFEFIYDGSTWQFTSTSGPRGEVGYTGSVGFMGSAGLQDWIVVNSAHTAVDKQRLIVDTSGGTFVLTLPATPAVGTYIQITDGADLLTTPLTVNRNGSTIEGIAADFVMDVPNATFEFIYDGATWQVTSTVGPRGEFGYTGSQGVTGFTGSVGLLDWTTISANHTAANRERLMLNSSTGPFNLTLPAAPATGTYIQLTDGANLATHNVTIIRNGSTIENIDQDLALDTPNATFEFIYDGSTWQVTSTAGPRGLPGFTGSAGADGTIGYNGSVGFTGSAGPAGDAGYTGSASTAAGYTGSQGDTGLGFRIAKSYVSVAALTADTAPTGIVAGEFAIIETGSVEDADNSRLYLWSGTAYTYVTDLSGAAGITGPAGSAGFTGSAGSSGTTGFTGSAGADGVIGYNGSAGTNGFTGSIGFTGSAGIQGDVGFVGSQGTPGEAAAIGYTGSRGFVGSQGAQGLPGIATSSLVVDTFAGTGAQVNFVLSVTPTGINQTLVNIDGVAQLKGSYSLSGSTLTFTEAPVNGANIEVTVFVYGTSAFVNRIYAADGTTANFAVTAGVTVDSIIVSDNGIVQRPNTDYSIAGATITFATVPLAGSSIQIREIPAGTGPTGPTGYTGSAASFDGNVTGNLSVSGTTFVTGDIIPTSNNTVNIGSATNRFGTLYLAANTIDLGGTTISTTESGDLSFVTSSGSVDITANTINFLGTVATTEIAPGSSGPIGFTGSAGTNGFTGSAGANGANGANGFTGSAGSNGFTGSAGAGSGASSLTVGRRTTALNISTASSTTINVNTRSGNIALNFS